VIKALQFPKDNTKSLTIPPSQSWSLLFLISLLQVACLVLPMLRHLDSPWRLEPLHTRIIRETELLETAGPMSPTGPISKLCNMLYLFRPVERIILTRLTLAGLPTLPRPQVHANRLALSPTRIPRTLFLRPQSNRLARTLGSIPDSSSLPFSRSLLAVSGSRPHIPAMKTSETRDCCNVTMESTPATTRRGALASLSLVLMLKLRVSPQIIFQLGQYLRF
jgi:hypothetical protein